MTVPVQVIIDNFHQLYYWGPVTEGQVFKRTSWMGVQCQKCPLDLWLYQEILFEIRPDLLIETGTRFGGSALYYAHLFDLLGKGEVLSIDVEDMPRPQHPRIRYALGSSADPELIASLLKERNPKETRMVVLDSDHRRDHVLAELRLFSPLVTAGSYCVVEDSNVNGHPVFPEHGPGPYEAIAEFLRENRDFVIDQSKEKFLLSFNPKGWLRRMPAPRPDSGELQVKLTTVNVTVK